jgi:molybdate transport system substrate-binding protein
MKTPGSLVTLFALALGSAAARAETVSVAVAANFTGPMNEIAEAFGEDTGHQAKTSFGSSGKFYAQIRNGAPFEVFLSADAEKPAQLVEDGLTVPDTTFTYALGSLVLWSADADLIQDGPRVLGRNQFRKLAIANPKLAPYGAAAIEVLEKLDVDQLVTPKLVQGENIAQTYQFVSTGNAELGFVALSQVIQDGEIGSGSGWVVPADMHAPIRQDAVILARGAENPAAHALMDYLRGERAQSIIRAYGYGLSK